MPASRGMPPTSAIPPDAGCNLVVRLFASCLQWPCDVAIRPTKMFFSTPEKAKLKHNYALRQNSSTLLKISKLFSCACWQGPQFYPLLPIVLPDKGASIYDVNTEGGIGGRFTRGCGEGRWLLKLVLKTRSRGGFKFPKPLLTSFIEAPFNCTK